jgi:hypothetical protein
VLLLALLHGIFLIVVTLFYLSLPFTLDDEVILIKITSGAKNKLFQRKKRPKTDRFFLLNVAWDKQLIPKLDTNGFEIGNQAITNRANLATFIQILKEDPDNYEFLFVDVNFLDPSPDDSLLAEAFKDIPKTLVSYHKDEKGKPVIPIIPAPLGLSDFIVDDDEKDLVLKYHLVQGDSLKTTPLLMFEQLHGKQLEQGLLWDKLNGRRVFNSFILDYPMDNHDVFNAALYNYSHMGELIALPPAFIHEMVKDKIVVIGDFEDQDVHNTIYGKMPGPLILINAFLALERGDNILSPYFIAMLLLVYTLISYKAIKVRDPITVWVEKKFKGYSFVIEFTVDVTFYLIFFGLVSVLSYGLFKIHLTILFLSFYMHFLEVGIVSLDEKIRENKAAKLAAAQKKAAQPAAPQNPV